VPEIEKTANILSILDTWDSYFDTLDEGIGTTYERFILHRYFEKLKSEFNIKNLIEVPSFGMTGVSGINSLWWGREGIHTTILDNNKQRITKSEAIWNTLNIPAQFIEVNDFLDLPFENNSFDLSWNFASLWFIENLDQFIAELKRITNKVIFLCVPNVNGLGFMIRKFSQRGEIPNFFIENVKPKNIKNILNKLNMKIIESGYLDIPPWPDIAMKKEDLIKKIGLGFLLKNDTGSNDSTFEKKCILDYFNGSKPNLDSEILRYDFLENSPTIIKILWGHHRYFIIRND